MSLGWQRSDDNLLSEGQIFGPYEVIRLLGKGGMGEVYEGRHTTLDESFALKLISREILDGAGSLDRFATEARESFRLKHPQIVRVDNYDVVDGQPYLRMELMPGVAVPGGEEAAVSLEDLLKVRGGRLSEAETLTILRDVLAGLAYAHGEGVIHRDLKPANILLYEDGAGSIRAKLADFGLVKAIGEDFIQSRIRLSISKSRVVAREIPGNTPKTPSSGTLDSRELSYIGTYDYMAPEQRDGMEATVRSDLYSVGLIAYRMLTGKKVIGMRRLYEMVEGLHPAWDDWVATAADPDPEGRFQSAAGMLEALPDEVLLGAMPDGSIPRRDVRSQKARNGNRTGLWVGLAVLLLIGGGLGYYFGVYQPEQRRIAEEARQAEIARLQVEEAARLEAERKAEEERLAAEAARKAAEEERARLAAEAERLRVEREKEAAAVAAEAERQRLAKLEAERRSEADESYQRKLEEVQPLIAKGEYRKAINELEKFIENKYVGETAKTDLAWIQSQQKEAKAVADQLARKVVELFIAKDYRRAIELMNNGQYEQNRVAQRVVEQYLPEAEKLLREQHAREAVEQERRKAEAQFGDAVRQMEMGHYEKAMELANVLKGNKYVGAKVSDLLKSISNRKAMVAKAKKFAGTFSKNVIDQRWDLKVVFVGFEKGDVRFDYEFINSGIGFFGIGAEKKVTKGSFTGFSPTLEVKDILEGTERIAYKKDSDYWYFIGYQGGNIIKRKR